MSEKSPPKTLEWIGVFRYLEPEKSWEQWYQITIVIISLIALVVVITS